MKSSVIRKQYSRAFKLEAVGLVLRGNKPATEIAEDLGIGVSLLYRWKKDFLADKENAFPGTGHLQDPEDEKVRALERELRNIKEERDILKKVVKLDNYYLPWELESVIAKFVDYYNNKRLHESLDNITPADMYHGRKEEILTQRQITKQKTLAERKRINLKQRHQEVSIT